MDYLARGCEALQYSVRIERGIVGVTVRGVSLHDSLDVIHMTLDGYLIEGLDVDEMMVEKLV